MRASAPIGALPASGAHTPASYERGPFTQLAEHEQTNPGGHSVSMPGCTHVPHVSLDGSVGQEWIQHDGIASGAPALLAHAASQTISATDRCMGRDVAAHVPDAIANLRGLGDFVGELRSGRP
jgi:hypothetical protein